MSPTFISRRGPNLSDLKPERSHDPYRGVVFVLLALALLGTFGALVMAAGILLGVALAQISRARLPKSREPALDAMAAASAQISANQDASIG